MTNFWRTGILFTVLGFALGAVGFGPLDWQLYVVVVPTALAYVVTRKAD